MKTTYMIFFWMNNLISEISALITQIEITAIAVRLYVTSSWYLRWRWMAKNLTAHSTVTLKSEAKRRKFTGIRVMIYMTLYASLVSFACVESVARYATNICWASKRIWETARLSSNVLIYILTRAKFSWSHRLLQCSKWWQCKRNLYLRCKVWDRTNPFVALYGFVVLEVSKTLIAPWKRLIFQNVSKISFLELILPEPQHRLTNI